MAEVAQEASRVISFGDFKKFALNFKTVTTHMHHPFCTFSNIYHNHSVRSTRHKHMSHMVHTEPRQIRSQRTNHFARYENKTLLP